MNISNLQMEELIVERRDLIKRGILSCNIYSMQDYEDFEAIVFLRLVEKIVNDNSVYYKLLNSKGYFVATVQNIVKNEYKYQNQEKRSKKYEYLTDEDWVFATC